MTAPERICLLPDDGWSWVKGPKPPYEENAIEYVRADLHAATKAQLAKAVEALRACRATFIRCQWDEKSVAVESINAVLSEIEKGEPK
jgi:hypothetical protein